MTECGYRQLTHTVFSAIKIAIAGDEKLRGYSVDKVELAFRALPMCSETIRTLQGIYGYLNYCEDNRVPYCKFVRDAMFDLRNCVACRSETVFSTRLSKFVEYVPKNMKSKILWFNLHEESRADKLRAIGFEGTLEPWHVEDESIHSVVCARNGRPVAGVFAASHEAWMSMSKHTALKEEKANALLIGAAPDLLVALNTLVKTFDPEKQSIYSFARESIDAAKEAINKAIGR